MQLYLRSEPGFRLAQQPFHRFAARGRKVRIHLGAVLRLQISEMAVAFRKASEQCRVERNHRTRIDMRVCAIARAPLISATVPPRKCCERDPLPKEAWQDATKASKPPSNQVVVIAAPRCAVARSLSQSPVSRASAQFCMSAAIASWSCKSAMLSLGLDARSAQKRRPFCDLGLDERLGLGGRHAQARAAAHLQARTH